MDHMRTTRLMFFDRLRSHEHGAGFRAISRRALVGSGLALAGLSLSSLKTFALSFETRKFPLESVPERDGVLSWRELAQAADGNPIGGLGLDGEAMARAGRTFAVEGFMMPYTDDLEQSSFLLTAYRAHCALCMPGGMFSLMEVTARKPVAFRMRRLTLQGRLQLLAGDESGLLYRLLDAAPIA